jgi:hypothetical protein
VLICHFQSSIELVHHKSACHTHVQSNAVQCALDTESSYTHQLPSYTSSNDSSASTATAARIFHMYDKL